MQLTRYINLCFAIWGLLLWVILSKFLNLLLEYLEITNTQLLGEQLTLSTVAAAVVAVGVTVFMWRHPKLQTWSNEVANELAKVTWPTMDETKRNTVIVIVFSLIVSSILATFDFFWKWLTDLILLG